MAISGVHYRLLKEHRDILPQGGSLLEIGEANWYGDMDPGDILPSTYVASAGEELIRGRLREAIESNDVFDIAKVCYAALFAPSIVHSIDMGGTSSAMRLDLNAPVQLTRQYDLTINHGTAEHVFNIVQVFCTMHDWTKPGGLMIHESPMLGWVDHGFYTLQPTLFYDLAAANGYEIVSVSISEIKSGSIQRVESREQLYQMQVPMNAMLFVVLRKGDGPFRVPMQGYYDGKLSEKGREAWQVMR